jgi:hypothetical protein
LDTTQDTFKTGQLYKISHYFSSKHDENDQPEALCISELFFGIYKVEGQTASALSK